MMPCDLCGTPEQEWELYEEYDEEADELLRVCWECYAPEPDRMVPYTHGRDPEGPDFRSPGGGADGEP